MNLIGVLLTACVAAVSANALEITGAVYGKDGNALAGVPVTAFVPITKTKLAEATTDKDGSFVLNDLPEGVVEIETSGRMLYAFVGDVVTINVWDGDESESQSPDAPRGDRSVSGVVTLDGKPLPNAPVWFHPNGNELVKPVYALSNAKGEFRIDTLAPQAWLAMIEPSLMPRVRAVIPKGEEQPFVVDLTKAKAATSSIELVSAPFIRGRVIDADGKPVARTRVQILPASQKLFDIPLDSTPRTDAAGRFSIPAPMWEENDEVCIAVIDPHHSPVRSRSFPLPTKDQNVDITMPRFDNVRVRITERNGNPVRNARLAFVSTSENVGEGALPDGATAVNESGELTLRLVSDTYDFYATAEGFQARSWNAQSAPKMDVILEREALLRGRVHRGEDGVAGVEVTSELGKDVTDENGVFELKGLAPGKHEIDIAKYDDWIDRKMEVEAPGNVDVSVPMKGTLRVHVADAGGGKIGDVMFLIEGTDDASSDLQGFATPEDGAFDIPVPEGTYQVQIAAEEYPPSVPREIRIDKDQLTKIDVRLTRGITITGRVVDESGTAIAGAFVNVTGENEEPSLQGTTEEDGTFTIKRIVRGPPAVLSVRTDGYLPFQKAIETERAMVFDVRLSRGLSLHGIVTSEGKPVAGASVTASTPVAGMGQAETSTGEDGRFVLTGLADARYDVYATTIDARTYRENVDPSKNQELVLKLDIPRPRGILYGTIHGLPPGFPAHIARRRVVAYTPKDGAEATIDDSGNYRMEDVPAGFVLVWAQIDPPNMTTPEKQVDVLAGESLRVDLQFGGNVRVTGRVTYEHKPLGQASILLIAPDESMITAQTNDDGMYEAMLPVEGDYGITVTAPRVPDFRARRDVRNGTRIDVDIQKQTIEGEVVDAVSRRPIANATIVFAEATYGMPLPGMGNLKTDAGGRFRTDVNPEALLLYAHAPGYAPKAAAASGTGSMVIELDPAAELRLRVTDVRSGAPLEVQWYLLDEQGAYVFASPDRIGDGTSYRFFLAPAKKYSLTITANGYETKIIPVTAPANIQVTMQWSPE